CQEIGIGAAEGRCRPVMESSRRTRYLRGCDAPKARPAAAEAVPGLVRRTWLAAARASARLAGSCRRGPLDPLDRTDRRRQDAGGVPAESRRTVRPPAPQAGRGPPG